MSEIIPRGEEGSAMTQDEEGPILAEAIGTTCAFDFLRSMSMEFSFLAKFKMHYVA
jgi:hypothetical protein